MRPSWSVTYVCHVVDVPVQGSGDRRRVAREAGLEVVAAQHHHDEVQRVVRHQRGREVGAAVAVRPVDVVDVGRAAAQTFLDHFVLVAEQPLQPARPPDVGPESHVLGVVRRGAVGVGVAEAEDAYGVGVGAHQRGRPEARQAPGPCRCTGRTPRAGWAQVLRGLGGAGAAALIEAITATRAATSSGVASPLTMRRTVGVTHSGMFPCFLAGSVSRFVRSSRSARTTSTRVS